MSNVFKYDLFVSYASPNADIAKYVVDRIEKRGKRCFIAPRDIRTGADYASEIVGAISNSVAVLLIFSSESDKSAYVLREINSAVSRNKTIIPLRVENFLPSEAMEFYLGPTHWLDAFPQVLETHLDSIIRILNGMNQNNTETNNSCAEFLYPGLNIVDISELLQNGWDKHQVTMREIELDYLCIPADKFEMNDFTEGTIDSWMDSVQEYDTSCALVIDDKIMGYCDIYPVDNKSFYDLKTGKSMIDEKMIDLFAFGGSFDAYIAMIAIDPSTSSQENYMRIFSWIFNKIKKWCNESILINEIGMSVYSQMTEKFAKALGFTETAINPANGKVYCTHMDKLQANPLYLKLVANRN